MSLAREEWLNWWRAAPGQAWLPLAVALGLDAAALAAAIWATATRRHMPARVRWMVGTGLLLAALTPLALDALALAGAPVGAAGSAGEPGDLDTLLRWGGGIAGLLLLAGGLRWVTVRRAGQHALMVLAVLGALLMVVAGGSIAWLAAAGRLPARWAPLTTVPAFSVLLTGGALALLGAAMTVAVVALGRTAGAGSRGMRARLAGAALLYAICVAGGSWLAATVGPAGSAAAVVLPSGLALVGLVALAATVRRLLVRSAAASGVYVDQAHPAHHRGRAAAAGGARAATRLAAVIPRGSNGPAPVVVGPAPWLTVPATQPTAAFTPPALRRSIFVERAGRPLSATAGYEAPHLIHLPWPPAPPVPPATTRPDGAAPAAPTAVPGLTQDLAPDQPIPPEGERRDLSPQFIASVVRLQAELARAGRVYTFEELLDLFATVAPRTR